MHPVKWTMAGGAALAAVAGFVWALMPEPAAVDLSVATRAPMEVTVAAEGMTRVRDTWSVSAPITGTVGRSPVQKGDPVTGGETVVAQIRPAAPDLLDSRSRLQAEAAVTEAQAAVRQSEVLLAKSEADLSYAEGQLARNRELSERGIISKTLLEDSEQRVSAASAAAEAARYDLELHRATLERMQAQLFDPEHALANGNGTDCCVPVTAPHSGTILDVTDMSARLVQAGAPLLEIGDLGDLQIEVDLLSSDAVQVPPDARAYIERWGGEPALAAHVTHIDPAGFTRVSALGIEDQRVRLRLDLDTPQAERPRLGDRFRVFVRVVLWSGADVLQVPQSALFRHEGGWAVFRSIAGRAVLTPVTIGRATPDAVQITDGLEAGDSVITYPGSRITDGARIAPRTTG